MNVSHLSDAYKNLWCFKICLRSLVSKVKETMNIFTVCNGPKATGVREVRCDSDIPFPVSPSQLNQVSDWSNTLMHERLLYAEDNGASDMQNVSVEGLQNLPSPRSRDSFSHFYPNFTLLFTMMAEQCAPHFNYGTLSQTTADLESTDKFCPSGLASFCSSTLTS